MKRCRVRFWQLFIVLQVVSIGAMNVDQERLVALYTIASSPKDKRPLDQLNLEEFQANGCRGSIEGWLKIARWGHKQLQHHDHSSGINASFQKELTRKLSDSKIVLQELEDYLHNYDLVQDNNQAEYLANYCFDTYTLGCSFAQEPEEVGNTVNSQNDYCLIEIDSKQEQLTEQASPLIKKYCTSLARCTKFMLRQKQTDKRVLNLSNLQLRRMKGIECFREIFDKYARDEVKTITVADNCIQVIEHIPTLRSIFPELKTFIFDNNPLTSLSFADYKLGDKVSIAGCPPIQNIDSGSLLDCGAMEVVFGNTPLTQQQKDDLHNVSVVRYQKNYLKNIAALTTGTILNGVVSGGLMYLPLIVFDILPYPNFVSVGTKIFSVGLGGVVAWCFATQNSRFLYCFNHWRSHAIKMDIDDETVNSNNCIIKVFQGR